MTLSSTFSQTDKVFPKQSSFCIAKYKVVSEFNLKNVLAFCSYKVPLLGILYS
jgi:hypothetical protein